MEKNKQCKFIEMETWTLLLRLFSLSLRYEATWEIGSSNL